MEPGHIDYVYYGLMALGWVAFAAIFPVANRRDKARLGR